MAEYVCKFATAAGQVLDETREGESEGEIRRRLTAEGYYVFSVRSRDILKTRIPALTRKTIPADEFLIFNEQFLTLSKSGLPLHKSLDLLARQTRSEVLRQALEEVQEEVRGGALLSEGFERVGKFPKVYSSTLRAGERSGSLDRVLSQYVTYQKARRTFRKRFLSALIYPAVLLVFLAILISGVTIFIIPRFADLYKSLDVELPAITVFLMTFSQSFRTAGFVFPFVLVGGILGIRFASRTPKGHLLWDRLKYRLPVAGKLLLKFSVAEFARTLATLLQGGIPIVAALETTETSVSSPLLGAAIARARQEVTGGRSLHEGLKLSSFFPPTSLDMIEVGEATGSLSTMLEGVAEFYEEDVNIDLSTLIALVDPVMLGVIAVVVGFVLVAFYMPLFSLAGRVH